jgi:hypothetical protein
LVAAWLPNAILNVSLNKFIKLNDLIGLNDFNSLFSLTFNQDPLIFATAQYPFSADFFKLIAEFILREQDLLQPLSKHSSLLMHLTTRSLLLRTSTQIPKYPFSLEKNAEHFVRENRSKVNNFLEFMTMKGNLLKYLTTTAMPPLASNSLALAKLASWALLAKLALSTTLALITLASLATTI